jgi:hypothetical protein
MGALFFFGVNRNLKCKWFNPHNRLFYFTALAVIYNIFTKEKGY